MELRLQRVLARAGLASRRQAEELIKEGKVRVDGKPATLGMKVDPARQRVTVSGKPVKVSEARWIMYHKPLGVVTTASDEQGRRTVFDVAPELKGLAYVGRLDVMTTGLLLLTTDGDAIHRLTHPRWAVPRRYTALVHGRATAEVERLVRQRVVLEGQVVEPRQVRVRPGKDGRSIVDITLTEGRNRVVRRWAEALGLKVERLARLAYGPVRLGDLPVGRSRPLTPPEIAALYKSVRLTPEDAA
jgi:pseudouridine synthase